MEHIQYTIRQVLATIIGLYIVGGFASIANIVSQKEYKTFSLDYGLKGAIKKLLADVVLYTFVFCFWFILRVFDAMLNYYKYCKLKGQLSLYFIVFFMFFIQIYSFIVIILSIMKM